MTIVGYKGNPEIGNTPVWVLLNIWRLGSVRDSKFCTNVSNKKLLNTAKCQVYSFYSFWINKGKPTRKGGITPSTISSNHENCCIKLNSHLSENFHFLMKLPLSNFFWNLCTFHIIFEFHLGISFFLFHFFCWNKVNRIWSI